MICDIDAVYRSLDMHFYNLDFYKLRIDNKSSCSFPHISFQLYIKKNPE